MVDSPLLLSVVIPAYKEAPNLQMLLPELNKILFELTPEYEIIVIDRPVSADDSAKVCRDHGAGYYQTSETGYGVAVRMGVRDVIAVRNHE